MSKECINVQPESHETAGSVYFESDINEGIFETVEVSAEPELPVIDPEDIALAEAGSLKSTKHGQVIFETPSINLVSESPDVVPESFSDFVLSYDKESTFISSTSTNEDSAVDFVLSYEKEATFTSSRPTNDDIAIESGNLPHFGDIDEGLEAITPESSSDIEISSILEASSSYTLYDKDDSDTSDIDVPLIFPEPGKSVRHFFSDAEHSFAESSHRQQVEYDANSLVSELPGISTFPFDQKVTGLTETEMIKRELQLAIQYKRMSRGKSELVLEKDEPKKYEVSTQ